MAHRYTDTLSGNFETKILNQFAAPGTLQHALEVHRIEIGNNSGSAARVGWGYSFAKPGIFIGDEVESTEAEVEIQDITYTSDLPGLAGNQISIIYVGDGTSGAETVDVDEFEITVHMDPTAITGSTATLIKAAVDGEAAAAALVTATITGTASNIQAVQSETFLEGGESAISPLNEDLEANGEVEITTALVVQGAEPYNSIQLLITDAGSTIGSQRYWNGSAFVEFTGTQYDAMNVGATGRQFNLFIPPNDWVALAPDSDPVVNDGLLAGMYVWIVDLDSAVEISDIDLVKLVNRVEVVADGNSLVDAYDGGKKLPGGAKIVPYVSDADPENSMIAEYSKAP